MVQDFSHTRGRVVYIAILKSDWPEGFYSSFLTVMLYNSDSNCNINHGLVCNLFWYKFPDTYSDIIIKSPACHYFVNVKKK